MIKVITFCFYGFICLSTEQASAQIFGNAVNFNGTTDYIEIPDDSTLRPASITIETWFKVNAFTGTKTGVNSIAQYLLFKQRPTIKNFEGYALYIDERTKSINYAMSSSTNSQKSVKNSTPLELNKWYHVAVSANTDSVKMYINGILDAKASTGFPFDFGIKPLYLGRSGEPEFEGYFNGSMDDVRLWNSMKTDNEIAASFSKELLGNETGLIASYNMNIDGIGSGITVPNNSTLGSKLNGLSHGTSTTPVFSSSTVLPVNLMSFSAANKRSEIELRWLITNQINLAYYEIERSNNGSNFVSIYQQSATGTSSSILEYLFTDSLPNFGTNFYRLKMVDKDGNFSYSQILKSKIQNNFSKIKISPNPVKNLIIVQIPIDVEINKIELINSNGQCVFMKSVKQQKQIYINTGSMNRGIYFLRTLIKGEPNTNKILIQ